MLYIIPHTDDAIPIIAKPTAHILLRQSVAAIVVRALHISFWSLLGSGAWCPYQSFALEKYVSLGYALTTTHSSTSVLNGFMSLVRVIGLFQYSPKLVLQLEVFVWGRISFEELVGVRVGRLVIRGYV